MASRKGADVMDEKCGTCKKTVGKEGVLCEMCECWYHCKCQDILEDTCKLLNQDKIHFYCGICDKTVGKIVKTLIDLNRRQDKLEEKISKVEEELNQGGGKRMVKQEEMDYELKKIRGVERG